MHFLCITVMGQTAHGGHCYQSISLRLAPCVNLAIPTPLCHQQACSAKRHAASNTCMRTADHRQEGGSMFVVKDRRQAPEPCERKSAP